LSFSGKHILITGASTGIGRATALLLARRGAKVSLLARNMDALDSVAKEIERTGGTAFYTSADVADRVALRAAITQAEAALGTIEGLFANAGIGGEFAPFTECRDENWDNIIATNLTGVFAAMRRVLPGMIKLGRGSIVLTGSLASERGMENNPAYVASKHAVLGLARAAAIENAAHNIRVNCVLPGLIETPLLHNIGGDDIPAAMAAMGRSVPLGHIGSAEETAEVVAFLLSDLASHVTGQGWAVDGGILGTLKLG
jgi:NAD(P)-dependent dehydrogenase (short-subunit alcohol dehydrogenase family)